MEHFPATHLPSFNMVGDMLVHTGKWRLLKHLLASTHGWVSSYPITLMHAQRYQQLVSASSKGDDSDASDDDEATYQEEKEEKKGYYIEEEEESDGVETGPNTWWSSLVI